MKNNFVKRLRNGGSFTLFSSDTKYFHKIQLNKNSNRICWQQFVSKDKRNWIMWNDNLSLKEVCLIKHSVRY